MQSIQYPTDMPTSQADLDNHLLDSLLGWFLITNKLCILRGEQIGSVLLAMWKTQPTGEWQHSLGVGPGLHENGTPCCDALPHGRPHSNRANWPHTWTFQTLVLQIRPSRYKVAQSVTLKPKSSGLTILLSPAHREAGRQDQCVLMGSKCEI